MAFFKNFINKVFTPSTSSKPLDLSKQIFTPVDQSKPIGSTKVVGLFSNLFSKPLDFLNNDGGFNKAGSVMGVAMTPLRGITSAASKIMDIFPDPSKTDTLYDGVSSVYNTLAQAVVALPSNLLAPIPGLSTVGDAASSILSTGFKATGLVADQAILIAANTVEAIKTGGVGLVNSLDHTLTGTAHVEFNGQNPAVMDSPLEIFNHIANYSLNNVKTQIGLDVNLAAALPDLLVDLTQDVKHNLGIDIPGAVQLNSLVDGAVTSTQKLITDTLLNPIIQLKQNAGLSDSDAGSVKPGVLDHVGESNIRGELPLHDGHRPNILTQPSDYLKSYGDLSAIALSPVRGVTDAASKLLDIFPDPTKTGTLYDGVNQLYNVLARATIDVPSNLLEPLPLVPVVGDAAGSILSGGLKGAAIVADHFIMMAANAVEVAKAGVVGTVNGVDQAITGQPYVNFNGQPPSNMDGLGDILSHSTSYTLNNLASHLVHDFDLLATIPDALIDVTRDIENNFGITIPGSDLLNSLVDGVVVNSRDAVIDAIVGNAIKLAQAAGIKYTNVGTVSHETMDHVGEGNIREGYPTHDAGHGQHGGTSDAGQAGDHSMHGSSSSSGQNQDHSTHGSNSSSNQSQDHSTQVMSKAHEDHSMHSSQVNVPSSLQHFTAPINGYTDQLLNVTTLY